MPAASQEISEAISRQNISRAVNDVFRTMLRRPAILVSARSPGAVDPQPSSAPSDPLATSPQVVGTVGFLGDINGLIYLYFDGAFARSCTGEMLGMSEAELDAGGEEVINDAIGEITNMTVGSFKNALSDQGYPCKLTIPSILRGRNFCVESINDSQRFIYIFESEGQRLVADVLLKTSE